MWFLAATQMVLVLNLMKNQLSIRTGRIFAEVPIATSKHLIVMQCLFWKYDYEYILIIHIQSVSYENILISIGYDRIGDKSKLG